MLGRAPRCAAIIGTGRRPQIARPLAPYEARWIVPAAQPVAPRRPSRRGPAVAHTAPPPADEAPVGRPGLRGDGDGVRPGRVVRAHDRQARADRRDPGRHAASGGQEGRVLRPGRPGQGHHRRAPPVVPRGRAQARARGHVGVPGVDRGGQRLHLPRLHCPRRRVLPERSHLLRGGVRRQGMFRCCCCGRGRGRPPVSWHRRCRGTAAPWRRCRRRRHRRRRRRRRRRCRRRPEPSPALPQPPPPPAPAPTHP